MARKVEQLFYTMSDVMKLLHVSHGTVRKLIDTKELKACKVCGNWRFLISDVETYLDKLYRNMDNA